MSETIEDVKRRNKRLLCVLVHQGWVVEVFAHRIEARCSNAVLHLDKPCNCTKPYWLVVHGFRAVTYKHEASVLKRLGTNHD